MNKIIDTVDNFQSYFNNPTPWIIDFNNPIIISGYEINKLNNYEYEKYTFNKYIKILIKKKIF